MILILDEKSVNDIVISNMRKTISVAKNAHYVDICMRVNGKDWWFQADWVKYLNVKTPPSSQVKGDLTGGDSKSQPRPDPTATTGGDHKQAK